MSNIDKYGPCPNCNTSWEGNDVYNELNSLSTFMHKSQKEIKTLASNYGWTESNPVKLSKAIVIQVGEKMFFKCPEIRCGKVYDTETGLEYDNIEDAKKGYIEDSTAMITKYEMTTEEIKEKFGILIAPNKETFNLMHRKYNPEDYE